MLNKNEERSFFELTSDLQVLADAELSICIRKGAYFHEGGSMLERLGATSPPS